MTILDKVNGTFNTEITTPMVVTPSALVNRNRLINGAGWFFQRGTSITPSSDGQYTADRWIISYTGTAPTVYQGEGTWWSGDNPNTPKSIAIDGSTGNTGIEIRQPIESFNVSDLKTGDTVTVSTYVYLTGLSSKTITIRIARPISQDNFSTLYDLIDIPAVVTTTGQRISATFTIPNQWFGWGTMVYFIINGGLVSGQTVAFGGLQFEKGSILTPFEYLPSATELILCQRYYEIIGGTVNTWQGAYYCHRFKVVKRTTPSLTLSSGSVAGASWDGGIAPTQAFRLPAGTVSTAAADWVIVANAEL